jgi:acetyl/propionyl-CoA carboxylase alpha subunit
MGGKQFSSYQQQHAQHSDAPASMLEQQASLAQLYNQWSEAGVPSSMQDSTGGGGKQFGTSSNSA